jgi:protein-L-isoaspartate(D-aspartate) O-methyltransferase
MTDFALLRRSMVDSQVRTADVTDPRLIAAMLAVPRERFVPPAEAELAYLDRDVRLPREGADERRLLKPMVLAKLLQAAEIGEGAHVLEVGAATGYGAAVIAHLAGSLVALEESPALADAARDNLRALALDRVEVVRGPLAAGYPGSAPYDVIVVNGAFEVTPKELLHQLKPGGRLVGVSGRGPAGKAMLFYAVGTDSAGRPIFDATAPLLPGFAAPPAFVF